MTDRSDFYLIDRVLSGHTGNYAELVDRYKDVAYRLAIQIVKNTEDAEEAVQDAFVKAFRSLDKFGRNASFSTWLYRIVYNVCLDRVRKKKVDKISLEDANHQLSGLQHMERDQLQQLDRQHYITLALNTMNTEENALVSLYYVQEKDMNEISQIMNLTHANVRKKMSRVRKRLKEKLEVILKEETVELL